MARTVPPQLKREMEDPLLTVSEAAEKCGVNYDTFLSWIRKGAVQHETVGPFSRLRVRLSEVEKQRECIAADPKVSEQSWCGVYFIKCGEFIKIGMTTNVWSRIANLQAATPLPLVLVGFEAWPEETLKQREAQLHQQFSHCRHRLEWFRAEPDLEMYATSVGVPSKT